MYRMFFLTLTLLLVSKASAEIVPANKVTAIEIARNELTHSLEMLAAKEKACKKGSIQLPTAKLKKIFDDTHVEEAIAKVAIGYFFMKSRMGCVANESATVVAKIAVLNELQPDKKKQGNEAALLIVADLVKTVELKAKYLSLDQSLKHQLGALPELTQPFDLIQAMEVLGL